MDFLFENVPQGRIDALQALAKAHGRTFEEEVVAIIDAALGPSRPGEKSSIKVELIV